jgi:hypothetical protein
MAVTGEFTVRVEGWREAARALDRVNRDAKRSILSGIAEGARPIADDANERLGRYRGIGRITTRSNVSGVFVQQSHRKVTGKRGDFGALQMRRGLIPAAEQEQPHVVASIERALDGLISREGLS